MCSFSADSKIQFHILCAFSSFKAGSSGYCYFFKGVGSISGEFFFLGGSDGAGFCVFCGGFFFIWVVLIVFGWLHFASWKCSGWKCNVMCPMLCRKSIALSSDNI